MKLNEPCPVWNIIIERWRNLILQWIHQEYRDYRCVPSLPLPWLSFRASSLSVLPSVLATWELGISPSLWAKSYCCCYCTTIEGALWALRFAPEEDGLCRVEKKKKEKFLISWLRFFEFSLQGPASTTRRLEAVEMKFGKHLLGSVREDWRPQYANWFLFFLSCLMGAFQWLIP